MVKILIYFLMTYSTVGYNRGMRIRCINNTQMVVV